MNTSNTGISAVILAGGQGSRMGGQDKGLLSLAGKPLITWVLARIRPQVDEVLISANRSLEQYRALGCPVLTDEMADFPGPLAGLARALAEASQPLVLCVPCDTPLLPHDLATRLKQALLERDAQIAVATTAERSHPTVCLCRKEVLPNLLGYLENGGRRVWEWQAQLKKVDVVFEEEAAFHNANSPEDLARLDAILDQHPSCA